MSSLPPISLSDVKDLPFILQEWIRSVRAIIGETGGLLWSSIDFTGSDLADLGTKPHNILQSLQGGTTNEYYHLTSTQHGSLVTISNITFSSGTYTPTLSNTTNITASTAYQCQYLRVGDTVTVSGKVDVDPTAAGQVQLGITLPISSNIGAVEDLGGTASAIAVAGQSAGIYGDATNNRATMEWIAVDLSNRAMFFTFSYQVI